MSFLIQYVADTAPWIYGICGLVALVNLYRFWMIRQERRQAVFSLEREKAVGELYNIFVVVIFILAVMGVTYFVSNTLAQAMSTVAQQPQSGGAEPDPLIVALPTPTYTPSPPTPTPTPAPPTPAEQPPSEVAVVVEESQPTVVLPTATPTAPSIVPPACVDERSILRSPGVNQAVSGQVNFVGTAVDPDFSYYKLEYAPGSNANQGFAYFGGGENQVREGFLAVLNAGALAPGAYTVRLVVVDTTGNFAPPCQVTIQVQ